MSYLGLCWKMRRAPLQGSEVQMKISLEQKSQGSDKCTQADGARGINAGDALLQFAVLWWAGKALQDDLCCCALWESPVMVVVGTSQWVHSVGITVPSCLALLSCFCSEWPGMSPSIWTVPAKPSSSQEWLWSVAVIYIQLVMTPVLFMSNNSCLKSP